MITVNTDPDGICTVILDRPGGVHNLLNSADVVEFSKVVEQCLADPVITGIIISSVKNSFLVGADIDELWSLHTPEEAAQYSDAVQTVFRRLETGGKPVVAALNGTALGGELQLALACHRRIAANVPTKRFGLPEVTLGLLPGGGGTQRLPRLIGVDKAVPYLLRGIHATPAMALADGLIDELCPPDKLLERAKIWLRENPEAVQPWDKHGFQPSIDPRVPAGAGFFLQLGGTWRAASWRDSVAYRAILACIYESAVSSMDVGLKVEQRRFAELVMSRASRNVIRTTFYHAKEARHRARHSDTGRKVAILGAGMMGAGIAAVCAEAGYEVVLVDRSQELAEKGKDYTRSVYSGQLSSGLLDHAAVAERLSRIHPTGDMMAVKGCEVAVEAVFEDRAIKAEIFRAVEAVQGDILLATNTSTLPIAGLAECVKSPDRFIGLHFFSPVDRMPLVEVIPGTATSEETLDRALSFVRRIRKTPIIVRDERGFFTSRVFSTYVREGLALLNEGVPPALIEHAGRLAGMPVGPLTVVDEISAETMLQIQRQNACDLGASYVPAPGDNVLARLVDELDRRGKKYGRGLYDYLPERRKILWPGLATHFPVSKPNMDVQEVVDRLMGIQALEAARCLEEKVIASPADGDLGSVLGWNYPSSRGGVLAYIDDIGSKRFVARCDILAQSAGPRFLPPAVLRDMAAADARFYEM